MAVTMVEALIPDTKKELGAEEAGAVSPPSNEEELQHGLTDLKYFILITGFFSLWAATVSATRSASDTDQIDCDLDADIDNATGTGEAAEGVGQSGSMGICYQYDDLGNAAHTASTGRQTLNPRDVFKSLLEDAVMYMAESADCTVECWYGFYRMLHPRSCQ
jgi:hypothetical protein